MVVMLQIAFEFRFAGRMAHGWSLWTKETYSKAHFLDRFFRLKIFPARFFVEKILISQRFSQYKFFATIKLQNFWDAHKRSELKRLKKSEADRTNWRSHGKRKIKRVKVIEKVRKTRKASVVEPQISECLKVCFIQRIIGRQYSHVSHCLFFSLAFHGQQFMVCSSLNCLLIIFQFTREFLHLECKDCLHVNLL